METQERVGALFTPRGALAPARVRLLAFLLDLAVCVVISRIAGTAGLGLFSALAYLAVYRVAFQVALDGQTPAKRLLGLRAVRAGGDSRNRDWVIRELPLLVVLTIQVMAFGADALFGDSFLDPETDADNLVPLVAGALLLAAVLINFFLADLITMVASGDRRSIHDRMAGTIVVRTR